MPGAFPPLAGSTSCSEAERAVGVVVNGLQGEVVVNGSKFNSVMRRWCSSPTRRSRTR
jgi:nitrite reductase (NO-forming)